MPSAALYDSLHIAIEDAPSSRNRCERMAVLCLDINVRVFGRWKASRVLSARLLNDSKLSNLLVQEQVQLSVF